MFSNYLKNFSIKYVTNLKGADINKIIYNSIHFAYWGHKCTGLPDNILLADREFILFTINFNKDNTSESIPSENSEIKSTGYGFQILISLDEMIFFRIFDWVTQKYAIWHKISFIE